MKEKNIQVERNFLTEEFTLGRERERETTGEENTCNERKGEKMGNKLK